MLLKVEIPKSMADLLKEITKVLYSSLVTQTMTMTIYLDLISFYSQFLVLSPCIYSVLEFFVKLTSLVHFVTA